MNLDTGQYLDGWLVGYSRLIGWLAGWLAGWLVGCSRLVGWLAGWLVDWF